MNKTISIIIPLHNEAQNIPVLDVELNRVTKNLPEYSFEFIYIDDGSTDQSVSEILKLKTDDSRVRLVEFSRNFGKELATTAGIHEAIGDAVIMLDADLQHPPSLIPEFIKKWEEGNEVVIGVRTRNSKEGFIKRAGSNLFYSISNLISDTEILSRATDFRLLDRMVVDEFKKFSERERITRALIDWLGFKRATVEFIAPPRAFGVASYNFFKLLKLTF